jgi:ppGpp synthetase/RelA/SpoT-type nucleotidyltranferase
MRTATRLAEHGDVAIEYRATFQDPLRKVTVGVRQFVERESSEIVVGQRLKRMPQILDKLARFPSMRLSQMEDMGGCRAIMPGGAAEVQGVLRRIRRNWQIALFRDYVREPKVTGYRAVHVVVLRDERLIEIQLRTLGQHDWAEAVERIAARTGHNLKDGEGPDDLVEYLRLVARAIYEHESGQEDQGFLRELRNMRGKVQHYWAPKG